ncbi:RsmF rRNA methyltransferase first C-terminal domain-containing protein [uncultured Limosilactobacillus sp.]|uniref:RsmF rRNA methyltransferase first C-terminal domain-containing protein n=1 Tax=uncultured Limosilactobacillus sp. TaxID=2837629 RepID=UPI0025FFEBE1|nr:RsmB/NOP family class I SAM-dependent RNA methyltransferase [uncultured Limosilactobacillus sp.]
MNLPVEFQKKYRQLLGDEAPAFLASFDQPSISGFRRNPLKNGLPQATIEHATGQVPSVPDGYFGTVNGHSLDHVTGWVYSQEPSAMYVGEVVDPQPGERVLDLCAAPGGKSTHLIAKMKDQGLLVANEIFKKRAQVLASNLERWGTQNTVILNERPDNLERHFPAFFDRILVDAPCSGEGMFRKEPAGIEYWNPDYPAECANRQRKILQSALKMLKAGGVLVYSTCTFAPEEDEQNIAWLLKQYPALEMVPIKKFPGMDNGRPDWADGNPELTKALRMFPHHYRGEGHFIAKLRLRSQSVLPQRHSRKRQRAHSKVQLTKEEHKLFVDFQKQYLPRQSFKNLIKFGDQLYSLPKEMPALAELQVQTPGLHLGTLKKRRFEPSLALALSLQPEQIVNRILITIEQWRQYVHGEVLRVDSPQANGWYLLVCDQHSVGFGKMVNGTIKNFFPKGLRF